MKNTNFESTDDGKSDGRSFEEELREWYDDRYPCYPGYRSQKGKRQLKIILFILLIPLIIISIYVAGLCLISGGWILESFYFTFDYEAELDDALLDELFYNLDADSRMNVTNETYFLVLSIPDLNYSIRFDYLFEFSNDNLSDLRIEHPDVNRKITSFETRDFYNPYNLSIEFQINSTDPDILNVTIFPPDNVINGFLQTYSVDSGILFIRLNNGEVIGEDMENQILVLPYNQRIIAIGEFTHRCPFK
jgi:hypothetical protein